MELLSLVILSAKLGLTGILNTDDYSTHRTAVRVLSFVDRTYFERNFFHRNVGNDDYYGDSDMHETLSSKVSL